MVTNGLIINQNKMTLIAAAAIVAIPLWVIAYEISNL